MLERDYHLADPLKKYHPFREADPLDVHFQSPLGYPSVTLFRQNEIQELKVNLRKYVREMFVALTVSMLGIAFYGRLPTLKNYPSWKIRLPISVGMLLIPIATNRHIQKKYKKITTRLINSKYKLYQEYLIMGDIRLVNPECRLEELPREPTASINSSTA